MTGTHKLIKLRVETVQNLKRLKTDMGLARLDELIKVMIRLTDEYRFIIKGTGWYDPRKGYLNENNHNQDRLGR